MEYFANFMIACGLIGIIGIITAVVVDFLVFNPTFIFIDETTGRIFETKKAFHKLPDEQQVKRFKYIGML